MPARDGVCWSCDLYLDGVKAAYVMDGGFGGEIEFTWYVPSLEQKFEEYCNTLPTDMSPDMVAAFGPNGYRKGMGSVVADFVDTLENEKKVKRWCKTKTLVRMKKDLDKEGGVYEQEIFTTFKAPWNPATKAALIKRYGDEIVEFVNERFQ